MTGEGMFFAREGITGVRPKSRRWCVTPRIRQAIGFREQDHRVGRGLVVVTGTAAPTGEAALEVMEQWCRMCRRSIRAASDRSMSSKPPTKTIARVRISRLTPGSTAARARGDFSESGN